MGTTHCDDSFYLFTYLWPELVFTFFAVKLGVAGICFRVTVSIPRRWHFSAVVLKITSLSEAISCFCSKMCSKLINFSLSTSMQPDKDLINQLVCSL